MTPKTAKWKLKEAQNIDFSISKNQLIWTTSAVTVQTHSGHCRYSDEEKKRVIKLVCGSSRLQKYGTRANRHIPQAAVEVYNEEEKVNLHVTTVRTWLHKAGLNWRVCRRGPGVKEMNCIARLAFRERHRHRTAILWRELCHCFNNFYVHIITVTATPQSHGMGWRLLFSSLVSQSRELIIVILFSLIWSENWSDWWVMNRLFLLKTVLQHKNRVWLSSGCVTAIFRLLLDRNGQETVRIWIPLRISGISCNNMWLLLELTKLVIVRLPLEHVVGVETWKFHNVARLNYLCLVKWLSLAIQKAGILLIKIWDFGGRSTLYTPPRDQYIFFLTKDMSSTKYLCIKKKLTDDSIITMAIYNHKYSLFVIYTSIFCGWISSKRCLSLCNAIPNMVQTP